MLFHIYYGYTERCFGTVGGGIIPWSKLLMLIREWYTGFGWYYQLGDGIQRPDVEIMVYLGILDTRKYFGSQKILTEITAILLRI